MSATTLKNLFILLRFPFSFYLMPVFLFALSQVKEIHIEHAVWAFFILHFLVYPASNGYNSYMDQDEESIGGIEKPPLPPKQLFGTTLIMDLSAIVLSWTMIDILFAGLIGSYIIASRLYSNRNIRLKQYPIVGFLTVVIFQGAVTYIMSFYAASGDWYSIFEQPQLLAVIASSVLIGGGYPLTQIYQHDADKKDGVRTISMLLGYRGTFIFTIFAFIFLNILLLLYFQQTNIHSFYILQLCLIPTLIWFFIWMNKTWRDVKEASFKNMMRMNNLSAISMNTCFLILLLN